MFGTTVTKNAGRFAPVSSTARSITTMPSGMVRAYVVHDPPGFVGSSVAGPHHSAPARFDHCASTVQPSGNTGSSMTTPTS